MLPPTYLTLKYSNLPANRVIGSGTTLDTSRLRYILSEKTGICPKNIEAYVIGEHGDHMVPLLSSTTIGGIPLKYFVKSHRYSHQHIHNILQ